MSVFLALMIIGLTGLFMMAIPAFGRHGHVGTGAPGIGHAGHVAGHIGPAGHAAAHIAQAGALARSAAGKVGGKDGGLSSTMTRFLPSPRMVFSFLALYGAFGNAFASLSFLSRPAAAALALLPAILLERFAVTPLWNFMLRSDGKPSSPLEDLVLSEAEAVTPFRNGRGVVAVVRDGRMVQFSATLLPDQVGTAVAVGDSLLIEDVDSAREHVVVSVR